MAPPLIEGGGALMGSEGRGEMEEGEGEEGEGGLELDLWSGQWSLGSEGQWGDGEAAGGRWGQERAASCSQIGLLNLNPVMP
jgi:hypothetical protein